MSVIKEGIKNVLDMWIGVAPVVMAVGTLALIIAGTYYLCFDGSVPLHTTAAIVTST